MGIGFGDGAGSESDFACAETVDDDFDHLEIDVVELENVMIREKTMTDFDFGCFLDGMWVGMRNENEDYPDVPVCISLFYLRDASEKVKTFYCDVASFPHHRSNSDVGVLGLDFRQKLLDPYVADFEWGFLSDKIRAG